MTKYNPYKKYTDCGFESVSDDELIDIILGAKERQSYKLVNDIKSICNLKHLSYQTLKKYDGMNSKKAIKLLSSLELSKRINRRYSTKPIKINSSKDAINYVNNVIDNDLQEKFYVLYLDTMNNLVESKMLFKGTLDKTIVHPREIFKYAYLLSSSKIICIHNHPSGTSIPSNEDRIITKEIEEIGKMLDIKLLDHIIKGDDCYSFFENGDLDYNARKNKITKCY